ncbi:MAG: phytoene desaturase family protein [Hyphomonadaceae bacterium]|nr:phytoene desaturase family protein [Hyphomonadaceae bacterium]
MKDVVVVGAGVAGLVAALELARRGMSVTVIERAGVPGGKVHQRRVGDAAVDAGPTVFTMRWVFEEIFANAGASLERQLKLTPLDILARHAWGDGPRLDLYASRARATDAIAHFAGTTEARGFGAFLDESRRMYEVLRAPFLEATKPTPFSLTRRVGLDRLGDLVAIRPFETLWRSLGRHFRDPRLRQLFARYATYCGSSPFQAPATMMLIAHVEQDGVWSIQGGMQRLAAALESLATLQGVRFRYKTHVRAVHLARGHVCALTLESGERLKTDAIVMTADPAALGAGAFGEEIRAVTHAPRAAARSLSAVTWAVAARTAGFPLRRHNVFFSGDYAAEFDDLVTRRRMPEDPTIYVCAQDRDERDIVSSDKRERLLVLVNAPADGDTHAMGPEERHACQTNVFRRLRRSGLAIDVDATNAVMTTPEEFDTRFPHTGGALYGRATHGWAATFKRPGSRTRIPGLYLAGGGCHPGAGVPMAALSGRTAARSLLEDADSQRTWRLVVTPGGTSTPSATTVDLA